MAPARAATLVGVAAGDGIDDYALSPLPSSCQYLYPDTPDYYYRYGDGYLYQVDRGIEPDRGADPAARGRLHAGHVSAAAVHEQLRAQLLRVQQLLPASYGYGYGDDLCNRYANGVVYQVDCYTGMVENVDSDSTPAATASGRCCRRRTATTTCRTSIAACTMTRPDYGYWYAPGAIYQYDPGTSLITSVAALLSPGFSVGQPLPMGYGTYNVPYAYRSDLLRHADAWYRYNNGYIYQVDPTTQLVSAIVASILT